MTDLSAKLPLAMLTSCKLTGNPEAVSSYHTQEENYYFEQADGVEAVLDEAGPGQSHVTIHGNLAASLLGFRRGQAITQEQFTNLLSGKDAKGKQVTRNHKVIGIDLTFSAPKSVSVAGLLTERDPRIVAAHDQSVLETLHELEYESAGTRKFIDQKICEVKTHNMAYVTVRDGFNRDHDPHLHTHVVIANMTSYKDKILALDGREIMMRDFNKLWGAVYRAKLAAKLKEHGYAISYTKKGEWRMDVISREVEMVFSGRRAAIVALKELGIRDMEAWRRTRKEKDPAVVKKDVLATWRAKLATVMSKSPEQNRQDTVAERDRWFADAKWSVEARQELAGEREAGKIGRWQVAARRATENSACVTDKAIITEYLTELGRTEKWEGFTYTDAELGFQSQVKAGHILATDDGYYTTWEFTRADRECVLPRASAGTLTMFADAARREVSRYREIEVKSGRKTLFPIQAAVAEAILSAGQGTVVVQGDAGAGKTTMLKGVQHIASGAGWEVVGVAVQGIAARKLEEESGIKSTTLASYLAQEKFESQSAQSGAAARTARLIVLDEAGMVGSRSLAELQCFAALHNDKVVLVGDRNQIQSVGAGKPFERLVEKAQASGSLLSLCENYRQRDPALLAAVDQARKGQMRESLESLDQMGRLMQIQDKILRREAISKLYSNQTLIVTGTKESRDDLNKRIRGVLLEKGELDRKTGRDYELCWMDADGVPYKTVRELAAGERVVFLKNDYKDYDLRNGECGTVTKLGEKELGVRLEDGREVQIDLRQYNAIDYGYALTTYKSQGQTFDKVVIEADTSVPVLQDQRNCYVQITRARDEVRIFTDDQETLKEMAGVLSIKRDTLHLSADGAEAKRMEERLRDMARGETQREVPCVRINTEELLKAAGGVKAFEKELRWDSSEIEKRINAREDLNPGVRQRVAEFYSRPEAADVLTWTDLTVDAKIAVAEVVLETRSREEACRALPEQQRKLLNDRLNQHSGMVARRTIENIMPYEDWRKTTERGPSRIKNIELIKAAGGVDRFEKILLKHSAEVEETLRGRQDLDAAAKQNVAAFLSRPAAANILTAPELNARGSIAVAEIALGMRKENEACRDLPKEWASDVVSLAHQQREAFGRERTRGRERGGGMDFSL